MIPALFRAPTYGIPHPILDRQKRGLTLREIAT